MKGTYTNWIQETTKEPLEWVSVDEIADPILREVVWRLSFVPLARTAEELHQIGRYYYEGWSRWLDAKKQMEESPSRRNLLPQLRTVAEASLRSMWLALYTGKPPQSLDSLIRDVEALRPDIHELFSKQMSVKDSHGNNSYKLLNCWAHGDVDLLKLYDRVEFPHVVRVLNNIVSQAQVQAMMVNAGVLSPQAILSGTFQ